MRTRQQAREEQSTVDLTPMIDVTFQLIIFFMVVSQITSRENVDLRLPDAQAVMNTDDGPRLFTVHIAPIGAGSEFGWFCYGDPNPRDLNEMRAILGVEAGVVDASRGLAGRVEGGISENIIVVRCDARCPAAHFGRLIELMAEARIYKVKVAVLQDREVR